MAVIILNEKVKVNVNTCEEAAVLSGFLMKCKYKGIRIGSIYLESSYRSEKEALLAGKSEYNAIYDGYYSDEGAMPLPIPVAVITPPISTIPVQPITVVDLDGTTYKNHKEQSYEEWLESITKNRKATIDVESVQKQLETLNLDSKNLGDFVAVEWDNTIQTTCSGELVVLKFNEGNANIPWNDRVNGEWVKFRGNVTEQVFKQSKWYGEEFGYMSSWYADFKGTGYELEILFWGDNGFLDVKVSLREIKVTEAADNLLDPDIEKAMILGGCWD